jgi:hypothetical protein
MTNEAIRPNNIRDVIAHLTGRPFPSSDKESGDLKEIPWEDKIAAALQTRAKKNGVTFAYTKDEDNTIFTWDNKNLTLTRCLEGLAVGEPGETRFYMRVDKKEWDDAPWFQKAFKKIPVGLRTMEQTERGEIMERVVYSAA